jgi:tRNA pseudouridine38-40 synthase
MLVEYDGRAFHGFQAQRDACSVQGTLEEAIRRLTGESTRVRGAGRTDAGVHALGQVASVQLAHGIEMPDLFRALNAKLPPDIRLLAAEAVAGGFHARYAARCKTYRYNLAFGAVASPFTRRYAWHFRESLDFDAMRAAAARLHGRHDFAAFQAVGTEVASTVRTIHSVAVESGSAALGTPLPAVAPPVIIEVVGDGFLRHMVRIIVGTLVAVGAGRVPAAGLGAIVASRARERAGPTAPPHGLFLVAVDY